MIADQQQADHQRKEGAEIGMQVLNLANALRSFEYNKYTDDSDQTRSSWKLHLEDAK